MHILSLFVKAISFAGGTYGRDLGSFRFWMRNVSGRMARVVGLPTTDTVRYSLDGGDEVFECPLSEWESLPIWTGTGQRKDG